MKCRAEPLGWVKSLVVVFRDDERCAGTHDEPNKEGLQPNNAHEHDRQVLSFSKPQSRHSAREAGLLNLIAAEQKRHWRLVDIGGVHGPLQSAPIQQGDTRDVLDIGLLQHDLTHGIPRVRVRTEGDERRLRVMRHAKNAHVEGTARLQHRALHLAQQAIHKTLLAWAVTFRSGNRHKLGHGLLLDEPFCTRS